jgi:beta-glucosidase
LPVTFPRAIEDVPPITDYALRGRTYRYLEKPPLFSFGYGLSFTRFKYTDLKLTACRIAAGQSVRVSVRVANVGKVAGAEVVQLYVRDLQASVPVPHQSLRGFCRIMLQPGASESVAFELSPHALSLIDTEGQRKLEPGQFSIFVGGSQPDARSVELLGHAPLCAQLEVHGEVLDLPY